MDSFLFDLLGLLLGFVTVLFLLSLLVTGLVQATQAILRLRARNLLFGITSVLVEQTELERPVAKEKAREILNAKSAPMFQGLFDPDGWVKLFGPQVSWLDHDQLKKILPSLDMDISSGTCDKIVEGVKNIDRPLSKRFLRNIRIWTVLWSMAVAFAFQATPSTLFFVAPQAVEIAALLEPSLPETGATKQPQALPVDASGSETTPSASSSANPPSGEGDADPAQPSTANGGDKAAGLTARQALAQLGMAPFRNGFEFYRTKDEDIQWANLFGTLLTVVLLSFGAPFWFNLLREMANLRDVLKPVKPASSGG